MMLLSTPWPQIFAFHVIFLFGIWLARTWITIRLTSAVQSEYDVKLEEVRGQIRKNEEVFKAHINSQEAQIQSLRAAALSNLSHRQDLIFEKQVNAIAVVWEEILAMSPGKVIAQGLAAINFADTMKAVVRNPELRVPFQVMGQNINADEFNKGANRVRPFLSLLAWAYFTAYQAIIFHAILKLHMLQHGIDNMEIIDEKKVLRLVQLALPNSAEILQTYGVDSAHHFLEELEQRLLMAFNSMLDGQELDKATVAKAHNIVELASEVRSQATVTTG